ncbi:OprD family porin [Stutzerimonas sp. VN223-3]|uniref:OprD family porin n=1 Tax=Stutzerimonas sp. VN223-3 TaxID=3384601 RepID=UPI0038B68858
MSRPSSLIRGVALLCAAAGHASAATGLTDDAHVSLLTRNFYFDRDYHDSGAQQSQRQEWAQGFIFKASTGYSPGTLGVGLDVLGLLGVKLDSSPDRTGSELLPYDHDDGRAPDTFGRLGVTLKLRLSQTELHIGELLPSLPILRYNDGRLLPQTFQGGMLTSREWGGLTLHAGQIRSFSPRSAADSEDLYVSVGGRTMVDARSDRFNYLGAEYALDDDTQIGAWTAHLEDVYRQDYYSLKHAERIGDWLLGGTLGLFNGREDGSALAGRLDNQAASLLVSANRGGHTFYLGLQRMYGDDGWITIDRSLGSTLANDMFANTFVYAGERSWQLRYDYDFAALGIPGLTTLVRYGHGDHIEAPGVRNGREWERDFDIAYTIQSGTFKSLNLRWRNASVRRDFGDTDFDENRLIVSYPFDLY